jgi:hypothetical protein
VPFNTRSATTGGRTVQTGAVMILVLVAMVLGGALYCATCPGHHRFFRAYAHRCRERTRKPSLPVLLNVANPETDAISQRTLEFAKFAGLRGVLRAPPGSKCPTSADS